MIDSIRIKNFRCFEDQSIEDLGMVNVVVGDNGSGKTALLEAIFLSQAGHPEVVTRFRVWRGLGSLMAIARTRGSYEAIWRDLFFNGLEDRKIEIKAVGTPENARSLTVFYKPDEPFTIPSSPVLVGGQKADSSTIMPLVFSSEAQNGGEPRVFKPLITSEGLNWGGLAPAAHVAFFSASFAVAVNPVEMANQFSDNLSKFRKEKRFIRGIRQVYPHIKNLGIESEMGQSMIFADINGLPMKIPLVLVSAGTHKLVAILLGMAAHPKGMVLVDEIENGFYYKAMPRVWELLVAIAKEYGVQIVATTHSKECLQAARQTIKKNENKFRLIRMESKKNRRISRVFRGRELEAALETGGEFR